MLCKDVMSRRVRWVAEGDSARVAAGVMRDENIGFLPVCNASGAVVGTLTDRDIATRLVAADQAPGTLVCELMTREVVACSPDDDLTRAEQLMREKHKARVICTDEKGHVVGIVSLADIALMDDGWRVARTLRQLSTREAHSTRPAKAG